MAEEYKYLPYIFETDEDMRKLEDYFLKMFNKDEEFCDVDSAYEIDMLNENPKVPDYIPEEVVAIFKKV